MSPVLHLLLLSLFGAGMAVSVFFYLASYFGARGFFRGSRRLNGHAGDDAALPGVTILKPLKGLDADIFENLSSFCWQDYPRYQIVFGVADAGDPAVRVVRRLQRQYPHVHIDLVVDSRAYGSNYKVSNLYNMYRAAEHDVIVIADSDIRVPADYLRRIVPPLEDPNVGVVTCLYRAVNTGGWPTLVESLFINTDFAPMVLVAGLIEKPTYAFGATMAVRRSTLEEIGGFLPLANYLADDYYLGHRIAESGYRLALSDLVVETVLAVGSWARLRDHQLRWARTYRNCRPGGYFGSIMTHGTLWATLGLLFTHFSLPACLAALAVCGVRMAVANIIANRYLCASLRLSDTLLVPLKDLFVSIIWASCFLGDTVRWSGHEFRVLKNGQMIQVSPAETAVPEFTTFVGPVPNERNERPAAL